MLEKKKYLKK